MIKRDYHIHTAYSDDCIIPMETMVLSAIEKGMEDIKAGRVYSADEVEAELKREFGI